MKESKDSIEYTKITILDPFTNKFVREWYTSCPEVSQITTLYFILSIITSFSLDIEPILDFSSSLNLLQYLIF